MNAKERAECAAIEYAEHVRRQAGLGSGYRERLAIFGNALATELDRPIPVSSWCGGDR